MPLAKSFGLPLMLALDVVMPVDNDMDWRIGTEYRFGQTLALRAGYLNSNRSLQAGSASGPVGSVSDSTLNQLTGFMAGFGVSVPLRRFSSLNNLNLDYAFVPYGELGNTHRISLGVKW